MAFLCQMMAIALVFTSAFAYPSGRMFLCGHDFMRTLIGLCADPQVADDFYINPEIWVKPGEFIFLFLSIAVLYVLPVMAIGTRLLF